MQYPKVYVLGHKGIKNHIKIAYMLTDSDYEYILEKFVRQQTIEFERDVEVYSDDKKN